jgi:hypothetical protein
MSPSSQRQTEYSGFEQGPIRPPSEAESLLIRITRNCPWNHCTFCPVYKGKKFSLRPADHVKKDIDAVAGHIAAIIRMRDATGQVSRHALHEYRDTLGTADQSAFHAALNWYACGMRSIFLQDGNSLIIPPKDLVDILTHLKNRFPMIDRVTSYARARTIARISDADMTSIAAAGLNRIHIGMESGSDEVLKRVRKGVDKATHIRAGQKVKNAGIELSEYVMPGLGGKELSRVHALETADALNQINPDFIRLRSLAIPGSVPLYEEYSSGKFEKLTDEDTAGEILLFLENLDGITSRIRSDHILNLFQDVEGKFPEDKLRMTGIIRQFLSMDPTRRMRYQVGRRLGLFHRLDDLDDPALSAKADEICRRHGITPDNADHVISELMKQFI